MISLSHHVRNLLQSFRGGQYLVDEALQIRSIDRVESAWQLISQKHEELASTLLDCVAFLESPRPERRPTDLNQLLAELIASVQPKAVRQRVRFIFIPKEQPSVFHVDSVLLKHAIDNILNASINSCRNHTEGRIDLRISGSDHAGDGRIEIRDDGARLDPQQLQQLFDPLIYASELDVSGLSMAVSRRLIESLPGQLLVNNNDGPGKHFVVELGERP